MRMKCGIRGLVLMAAAGVALAQPAKLDAIRVIGGGMPLRVAGGNGILDRYGLEVRNSSMPNSDSMRADLAAGRVDIAHANVDNAVGMVELAGADVIIVMGGSGAQEELVAQPGIGSVKDLRGKTLIVDAPYTAMALMMKKILLANGVQPGVDCELKPVGVTPQRLAAMRENKAYAASMMSPPTSILARRDGYVSLASIELLAGKLQGAGAFVRRDWAQEHAELLERYIAASIEAQRWMMTPANKAQVLAIMIQDGKLPPDVAQQAYEMNMAPRGWQKDLQFDVEGFRNVLKLRAEVEGSWGGKAPAPDKYYDLSYYRKALQMVR